MATLGMAIDTHYNPRDYDVVLGKTRKNWRRIVHKASIVWSFPMILAVLFWVWSREPYFLVMTIGLLGVWITELLSPRFRIFASGIWCPVPHPEDVYELQRERVKADLETANPGVTVPPRAVAVIVGDEDDAWAFVPATEVDAQGQVQPVWLYAVYASGGDRSGKRPKPCWLPIEAVNRGPLERSFRVAFPPPEVRSAQENPEATVRAWLPSLQQKITADLLAHEPIRRIDWQPVEHFEVHPFAWQDANHTARGWFVLVPYRYTPDPVDGQGGDRDAYAVAYALEGMPERWFELPLMLDPAATNSSPEAEARSVLAEVMVQTFREPA